MSAHHWFARTLSAFLLSAVCGAVHGITLDELNCLAGQTLKRPAANLQWKCAPDRIERNLTDATGKVIGPAFAVGTSATEVALTIVDPHAKVRVALLLARPYGFEFDLSPGDLRRVVFDQPDCQGNMYVSGNADTFASLGEPEVPLNTNPLDPHQQDLYLPVKGLAPESFTEWSTIYRVADQQGRVMWVCGNYDGTATGSGLKYERVLQNMNARYVFPLDVRK
jgi:hypothetical protein